MWENGSMTDQTMSVGNLAAGFLWVLAVAVMTAGTVMNSLIVCMWAVVIVAGAGVALIRQYFVKQETAIRNAYRIGRDASDVRQFPTQRG